MAFDKIGTLTVRAYTGGGALPVADAIVKISGADEENRAVEYSVLTDRDGMTEKIPLPTPRKILSQAPGAKEQAFANYNVEILSEGYFTKRFYNVAIFDDTESILSAAMIPINDFKNDSKFPKGNLDSLIIENEMLE